MPDIEVRNIVPKDLVQTTPDVAGLVQEFALTCGPVEDRLYVHTDARTGARYCLCHMRASTIVKLGTIDVPLDPDGQPEYRANREPEEDHVAYLRMQDDALDRRSFVDIVAEYTKEFNPRHPIKVIGGQHRFKAMQKALADAAVDELHCLRMYFGLDAEQRTDVQLISNTNIAVSPDWLDRMDETRSGPELRDWCQAVGLLDQGVDFISRRQRGKPISVRDARTFIMNYYYSVMYWCYEGESTARDATVAGALRRTLPLLKDTISPTTR